MAFSYLGMERFTDAEASASLALELAPESAKPGVERLAAAIEISRQGAGFVQAAETALADGMAGKAAPLFEQAWNAGQKNPDLGLKAADLYANRLGLPVDAARVLRQVIVAEKGLSEKGSPAADQAAAELQKLADTLREIADSHVAASRGQEGAEALQSLQLAEDADPALWSIYRRRAQLAAEGDNAEALQSAIKVIARLPDVQENFAELPAFLAQLPKMAQWLEQPAFQEFLSDLLGSNGTKSVADAINKRIADQEAAAAARADYDQKLIEYNEARQKCGIEWARIHDSLSDAADRAWLETTESGRYGCRHDPSLSYCIWAQEYQDSYDAHLASGSENFCRSKYSLSKPSPP
jgi:hypothetical protein